MRRFLKVVAALTLLGGVQASAVGAGAAPPAPTSPGPALRAPAPLAPAPLAPAPLAAALPAPALPALGASASILMYHHIALPPRTLAPVDMQFFVPPATFEQQIYYLMANGYSIVSLDQVVDALTGTATLPPRAVAITIDDGWQDFWQNGLPIVNKYAIPVTLFAIADADRGTYMNPSERWILAHSGVQIAAHTLTHPHLTKLLPAVAHTEIVNSRSSLEKELGLPVRLFAYPYGDFNGPVKAMVSSAGYKAAFAAGPSSDEDSRHLFELPRVEVSYYDTLDTFGKKAADYRWARTHLTPMPAPPRPAPVWVTPAPVFDPGTSPTRLLNNPPSSDSTPAAPLPDAGALAAIPDW